MSVIDPTEYVEVEEGVTSLKFGDEKQQAKFELGVCMAVYKWEELTTAVDNSWGGANSAEKRDWISGIVIDLFDEKAVDVQLIEETLLYAMVDEFDTEIDNDSALEIGALIMKIYKEVADKIYSTVDTLYEKWNSKQQTKSQLQRVVVDTDPNNPSSDEESDDDDVPQLVTEVADMELEEPEPKGPVVDDDGFELVQRNGRRR